MKNVTCPNCGNHGSTGTMEEMINNDIVDEFGSNMGEKHELAFRSRGQIEGYPIWICNKCEKAGVWMKTGFFGKPKPITGERFDALKTDWESGTGRKF